MGIFLIFWGCALAATVSYFVSTSVGVLAGGIFVLGGVIILVRQTNGTHSARNDNVDIFANERFRLEQCRGGLDIKTRFFVKYRKDETIFDAYTQLQKAIIAHINSCERYMSSYDYHLCPPPKYLHKHVLAAETCVAKLSELSDLCLQLEDSASDVSTEDVSNFLTSMSELLEED